MSKLSPKDAAVLHNRIAKPIAAAITAPIIQAGGDTVDVLFMLETVVATVVESAVEPGSEQAILDGMLKRVVERVRQQRTAK